MPHKIGPKKSLRKNIKRRQQNRTMRSSLRTLLKMFDALLEGDAPVEEKQKAYSEVTKKLDQSAAKNLIHSNKAARTKSRLAAKLSKATATS